MCTLCRRLHTHCTSRAVIDHGADCLLFAVMFPGLLGPAPDHRSARSPRRSRSPPPSATAAAPSAKATAGAVATAAAPKQPARNAPLISPYPLGPKMSTFITAAEPVKDNSPSTSNPLSQAPATKAASKPAVATASAAASQGTISKSRTGSPGNSLLQSHDTPAFSESSDLAPIASAKPAATAPLPTATAAAPAATAQLTSAATEAAGTSVQEPTPDVYSPIRSPPAANITPPSLPTLASLPAPQLNPLPPPPQAHYQQPDSNTGITQYATAEQVAAWQQQQAYQGYYGGTYPYPDPTYGYAYSQTQAYAVPGYGAPPSVPVGVAGPHPPAGVPPPRPPPLGPNSPPPKRPLGQAAPASASSVPGGSAGPQGPTPPVGPAPPTSSSAPSSSSALVGARPGGALPLDPAPSSAAAPQAAVGVSGQMADLHKLVLLSDLCFSLSHLMVASHECWLVLCTHQT